MFTTFSLKRSFQIFTIAVFFNVVNLALGKDKLSIFDPNLPFESVMPFDGDVAFVKINGKWWLIDMEGNILNNVDIDNVHSNTGDIFSVEKKGKIGFMNRKGELIIDFQYTNCFAACSFYHGLALVNIGGRYGYINEKNKFIINPYFDDAYEFRKEGFAFVKLQEKFGLIDKNGKYLIEPQFDHIPMPSYINISEGLIPVKNYYKKGAEILAKYSYSDLRGRIKFSLTDNLRFKLDGSDFRNGFAIVDEIGFGETKKRFINSSGVIVFDAYQDASSFYYGLAAVKINGKFGYINPNGSFSINPQFDTANSFLENGHAIVSVGLDGLQKSGIINRSGEFIINPIFEYIVYGSNNFYMVKKDNKWGVIDTTGAFAIPTEFSDIWISRNGIAIIVKNGKYGFRRIF